MAGETVMVPGIGLVPAELAAQLGLSGGPPQGSTLSPVNYGDGGPGAGSGIQPGPGTPEAIRAALSGGGPTAEDLAAAAGLADPGFGGGTSAPFDLDATLARANDLGAAQADLEARERAAPGVRAGTSATAEQVAAGADGSVGAAAAAGPSPGAADQGGQAAKSVHDMTYDDTLAEYRAALADAGDVAGVRGDVEADAAIQHADLLHEANVANDLILRDKEAAAIKDAEKLARTEAEYTSAVKAFADKKIDRNRLFNDMGTGRKVMLGLASVLSGLGAVLKHEGDKPIPAITFIMDSIREDVDLQFREKESLGQAADLARGGIDVAIQTATARQSQFALAMAGNVEKAARLFEEVAAKTESQLAQVRAAEAAVELRKQGADLTMQAVQLDHAEWQAEEDRRVQERGQTLNYKASTYATASAAKTAREGREQDERFKVLDYDLKMQEMGYERQARIDAAKTTADKARAEVEIQDMFGVDKATGQMTNYRARSPEVAVALAKQKGATDAVIGYTDELVRIKAKYKNPTALMKSEEWQRAQALIGNIQIALKEVYGMGALDAGALKVTNKMMGGDVARDGWTANIDAGVSFLFGEDSVDPRDSPIGGLKQLRKSLLTKFNADARSQRANDLGAYVDYNPKAGDETAPEPTSADASLKKIKGAKTPSEIVSGSAPGAGTQAVNDFLYMGDAPESQGQEIAGLAAQEVSSESGRVTKEQRKEIESLVASARGKSKDAMGKNGANVISSAKSALVVLLQDPRVSGEVLQIVKNRDDIADLIDQAIESTSDEAQAQVLRAARDGTGDTRSGGDIKVGKDEEGNIALGERSVSYKPSLTDTAIRTKAMTGDAKAVDKLVEISVAGGARGDWARNQLLDLKKK